MSSGLSKSSYSEILPANFDCKISLKKLTGAIDVICVSIKIKILNKNSSTASDARKMSNNRFDTRLFLRRHPSYFFPILIRVLVCELLFKPHPGVSCFRVPFSD